eukprot:scpid97992/ scgid4090/ 
MANKLSKLGYNYLLHQVGNEERIVVLNIRLRLAITTGRIQHQFLEPSHVFYACLARLIEAKVARQQVRYDITGRNLSHTCTTPYHLAPWLVASTASLLGIRSEPRREVYG